MNWYQEKICLRIHKCTEAESLSSPFSRRPTQKVEKMEIIIKSRITTYSLPYSLWKSLQRNVLGNESKQPLHGIVGKILSAGAWKNWCLHNLFYANHSKKNKKIKPVQALCIQIPPVKYCSVCQTRKYLDTGKQLSVPFIQQTLKRKTSGKLRLIASHIYEKAFTTKHVVSYLRTDNSNDRII